MLPKMPVLPVLLILLCPAISHGEASEPSNYDECILDAMRGVSSDVAARAIMESCRNLFPEATSQPAPQVAPPPPPMPAENVAAPAVATTPAEQTPVPDAAVPLDASDARSLTADELARLRTKAKVFGSTYRVTIHNDNPDLTLTEVTIAVWDDSDLGVSREEFTEVARIPPQTEGMVKYTVVYRGNETGWRWSVVAARGVE